MDQLPWHDRLFMPAVHLLRSQHLRKDEFFADPSLSNSTRTLFHYYNHIAYFRLHSTLACTIDRSDQEQVIVSTCTDPFCTLTEIWIRHTEVPNPNSSS